MPRYMYEKITNVSTLSWAVNNDSDKENPDEHLAQVALFFDEMQATLLGAEGNKKDNAKGEGTDRCAMFKEMCSAPTLKYRRNVEAKDKEGLSTRVLKKGTITCELAIFAGMNRPPASINDAFSRRFEMKACIFTPRKDGVTFEECKIKDQFSRRQMLVDVNRDNSRVGEDMGSDKIRVVTKRMIVFSAGRSISLRVMWLDGAVSWLNIIISTQVHGASRVEDYDKSMRNVYMFIYFTATMI